MKCSSSRLRPRGRLILRLRPRLVPPCWRQADDGRPARTWAQREQWALVLQARGIAHVRARRSTRSYFYVPPLLENIARAELRGYSAESLPRIVPASSTHPWGAAAIFFLLSLMLWHGLRAGWRPWAAALTSLRDPWNDLAALGAADAVRMKVYHEWYRAVTALTLHADSGHLLSNVAFGGIFCVLLCRAMGLGMGLLLTVAGGALGNICNTLARQGAHVSMGFSTALFAAVGAMSGSLALKERRKRGKALLPLAAGGAILAMLGTEGERTDYGAHVWGLLSGILLGALAQGLDNRRGTPLWSQWAAGALALALTAGSWWWAGLRF